MISEACRRVSREEKADILALPIPEGMELDPGHMIENPIAFKDGLIRDFSRGKAQQIAARLRLDKLLKALEG